MNEYKLLKEKIMEFVTAAKNQRVRPHDITTAMTMGSEIQPFTVNAALEELVAEGELVYAYRDPDSYIEFPCNGCDGEYHAARPMKVVTDETGNMWICDKESLGEDNAPDQSCWECGSLNFTRTN